MENAIVKNGIANDMNGTWHIFMNNRYVASQFLALMLTNYNIHGVGTCKANLKGFASHLLQLDSPEQGTFKKSVDSCLGMVITR